MHLYYLGIKMAHLIQIGNSQGIRIPKALIEQTNLEGVELEIKVVNKDLLICPIKKPRDGWKQAFDTASDGELASGIDSEWLNADLTLYQKDS